MQEQIGPLNRITKNYRWLMATYITWEWTERGHLFGGTFSGTDLTFPADGARCRSSEPAPRWQNRGKFVGLVHSPLGPAWFLGLDRARSRQDNDAWDDGQQCMAVGRHLADQATHRRCHTRGLWADA